MQVKSLIALGALALAAGTSMAAQPSDGMSTPASGRFNSWVSSRYVAGSLQPAGEAIYGVSASDMASSGASGTARTDVRRSFVEARRSGQLQPAGEAADGLYAARPSDAVSTLARSDVKAETLRARASGQLVPAGQDIEGFAAHAVAATAPTSGPFARLSRFGRSLAHKS